MENEETTENEDPIEILDNELARPKAGQPTIIGHRILNDEEIDQINHIKTHAHKISMLINHLHTIMDDDDNSLLIDERCMNIAVTHLQDGFMWLTRSVSKPDGF